MSGKNPSTSDPAKELKAPGQPSLSPVSAVENSSSETDFSSGAIPAAVNSSAAEPPEHAGTMGRPSTPVPVPAPNTVPSSSAEELFGIGPQFAIPDELLMGNDEDLLRYVQGIMPTGAERLEAQLATPSVATEPGGSQPPEAASQEAGDAPKGVEQDMRTDAQDLPSVDLFTAPEGQRSVRDPAKGLAPGPQPEAEPPPATPPAPPTGSRSRTSPRRTRPHLPPEERRSRRLIVRLTPAEHLVIKMRAREKNLSSSNFVRLAALDQLPTHELERQLYFALRGLAVRLRQKQQMAVDAGQIDDAAGLDKAADLIEKEALATAQKHRWEEEKP